MYMFLLPLSMTLSVKVLCVSLPTVILCLCQQLFCLSVLSFNFTEKSDCPKANHVISMISSTTTFVKLRQMIC